MSYKTVISAFVVAITSVTLITSPLSVSAAGSSQSNARQSVNSLELVSARDNVLGSFTASQSVYATKTYIYLASAQGTLFVLKRNQAENFPLVQSINIGSPLTGVLGFNNKLFVTSQDGYLREYSTTNPLTLKRTVQLSTYGLSSIAVINQTVYVARGQASLAVDNSNVYLAQLNEGDVALELNSKLQITKTYGQNFEADVTVIYNRANSNKVRAVSNPTTTNGSAGQPALFTLNSNLIQTNPGCCGTGVLLTNTQTYSQTALVNHPYANAVTAKKQSLLIGDEAGKVGLYRYSASSTQKLTELNLRELTGNNGSEDIEIRSIWIDGYDNLVFAASSWGNDESRSPELPSVFILEIK